MILNKLWNAAKKLSHSGDENNKPLVEEKRLVVNISGRKKKLRNLHHIVGFGILIIFFILLLFLIVSILPYSDYQVCFTCFPRLAEKIIKKQNHNMHLDSKYDQTIPNSKTISKKSSNSSVLETIGKVSSDETSTLRNLNEESVIIRGKNKVPEKMGMLEDTKKVNTVSKTALPQTFLVNERKYDSKHNVTKDVHQINSEEPLTVGKLPSFYNDSSNSNSILLNKLKNIRKVTSTETPTLINLNEQSVIIRGKNTVPEKIWIVKDIQDYNVSKPELPQTFSVNERIYDAKHNVTNDKHEINGKTSLIIGKLSNSYNDPSKSNFLLRNMLKKFPLNVPTVKTVSAIKSKHESVPSIPNTWMTNDSILVYFSKTNFGKHILEDKKNINIHPGLESTPQLNPVNKNKLDSLTNNDNAVSENPRISYYPVKKSAAENASAIKNEFEDYPSIQDKRTSNEMIFPSFSKTTIAEYQLEDSTEADIDSGLKLTHSKNRGFKNKSENSFDTGRIVGENLSHSYHPIKTSDIENVSAIKYEFEDDPSIQDQWTSNKIIFPFVSETPVVEYKLEELENADVHSGVKLTHHKNRTLKNELEEIFNIGKIVGENHGHSSHPIKTSDLEKVSPIKNEFEDDHSVQDQRTTNDMLFLPFSETALDKHLQKKTKKTDMHSDSEIMLRINRAIKNESKDKSYIGSRVEENFSISYSPIEPSTVENILPIKDNYEDDAFVPGQLISSDITFLPLSDPYSIDRNVDNNPSIQDYPIEISADENMSTIKDKNEDDTFVLGQMISSDNTFLPLSDPYSIDRNVGENPSISYSPIETSGVENITTINDKSKDDTFVLDQMISSDNTFLPLSDPYSIHRNLGEIPTVSDYPIETSAVENIPAIKDKHEDDTFVPGQLISSDITFLPLSNPYSININVDDNPSLSNYPTETSAIENITTMKDKSKDDTFVLGQMISSDNTFLPLSDPYSIHRNVGEIPTVSDYPIETSAVENIPTIKDKYEDDTFVPGQLIFSDIKFLPLSYPHRIDRSVGVNPSVYPIEASAVENMPAIKDKYEDDSFVPGQLISSDITFLPLSDPHNIDKSVGENPSVSYSPIETSAIENITTIKDKSKDDTFVLDQMLPSDNTLLPLSYSYSIDRSVGENPSVSYSPIETSAVENVPAIKEKYGDDTFVPGQLISSDITFLPLPDLFRIDRSVGENPSIPYSPIESSAVENILAIKDKYEDDTSVPGQLISSDITFLPLSDPHNIDKSVGENPSVSFSPIETSAIENITTIKDKSKDDTFVLDQMIPSDITFLPLSDPQSIDRSVGEKPSVSYSPIETFAVENIPAVKDKYEDDTFVPGQLISSDITFLLLSDPHSIDRSVGENPSVSYSPIESSAAENIPAIKDKYEDDTIVPGQLISSDITFLPLSGPYSIVRSVDGNPSIEDYSIETSSTETLLSAKSEFEGYPSLLDQQTSNDMIFQFPMQPKFDSHLVEEKMNTKLDSSLELTSRINTAVQNKMEEVSNIDENVDENLSISYYLTENSDAENVSIEKKDEDFS